MRNLRGSRTIRSCQYVFRIETLRNKFISPAAIYYDNNYRPRAHAVSIVERNRGRSGTFCIQQRRRSTSVLAARLLFSRELFSSEILRHNVDILETRTTKTGVRRGRGQTSLWIIIGTRTLVIGLVETTGRIHNVITVAAAQVLVTPGLVMQEGIHLDAVIETARALLRGHVRRRRRRRLDVDRRPLVPGYLVVWPQRAL